jgi:hypothetical protein
MNLLLATLIVGSSVAGGIGLCFYLLQRALHAPSMTWFLEHVFCPLVRVLILLSVVSQVYPAIDGQSTSIDFWRSLAEGQQLRDIVNILFIFGLLLAFIPVVDHPLFALPLQSMLTIALVFHWQYAAGEASITLLPSFATLAKILFYMLLAWLLTRQLSIPLARALDQRFTVSGTIRLVSDTLYMLLQIPVMLIYLDYLGGQLA